jgi:hypothetical protein
MIESSKLKILSDVGRLGDLVIIKNNKHGFQLILQKHGFFWYGLKKIFNI